MRMTCFVLVIQAINFWKVLVLNDEHTERKYVFYFLLGWGKLLIPVCSFYCVLKEVLGGQFLGVAMISRKGHVCLGIYIIRNKKI